MKVLGAGIRAAVKAEVERVVAGEMSDLRAAIERSEEAVEEGFSAVLERFTAIEGGSGQMSGIDALALILGQLEKAVRLGMELGRVQDGMIDQSYTHPAVLDRLDRQRMEAAVERMKREMGERGQEKAKELFGMDKMVGEVEDLYDELLSKKGRQNPKS